MQSVEAVGIACTCFEALGAGLACVLDSSEGRGEPVLISNKLSNCIHDIP